MSCMQQHQNLQPDLGHITPKRQVFLSILGGTKTKFRPVKNSKNYKKLSRLVENTGTKRFPRIASKRNLSDALSGSELPMR